MPTESNEHLRRSVERARSVQESVTTLLGDLSSRMRSIVDNTPEEDKNDATDQIEELADDLDSTLDALAAAVVANTPQGSAASTPVEEAPPVGSTGTAEQGDAAALTDQPASGPESQEQVVIGEGGEAVQPTDATNDQGGGTSGSAQDGASTSGPTE